MSIEDRAQEAEAAEWERNNRPRRGIRIFSPSEPGYGPELCLECEDDMPDVRRAYGYNLCTECATERERLRLRGLL